MTRTTDGVVEVVVDLVHLEHDVVGHLGLGQQHVHVAGQPARDGVDAEADVDAALAQLAGQVGDAVLGLRDGHAVAGGDDDRAGRGEQFGGAVGGDLAVLAVVLVLGRAGLDAEAAGDDGDERPVHRLAHDVGQVGTGGADERAGDDQQVVGQQEARRRGGPARVAVEHRHHDGHVAAADRGDQVPAEQQGQHGDGDEQPQLRGDDEPHREREEQHQRADVEEVLAGQHQRRGLDPRRELEVGHDRPGERDRADEHADEDLGGVDAEQVLAVQHARPRRRRGRLRRAGSRSSRPAPRPGRRSECSSAISSGMPVISTTRARHRPIAAPIAIAPTSRPMPSGSMWRLMRQGDGGDQRDRHAGHAEGVAGPRRFVLGQPGQGQDEQQGRDDVGRGGGGLQGEHAIRSGVEGASAAREHGEHAARHREATEDVDAGEQDRDGGQRR